MSAPVERADAFRREPRWWRDAVVYQIYPRSYRDASGDGVGDLAGIASRLDHLVETGVDTLWVSPFYPSPMADFGYDVADYTGVDPLFGTMADFDALLEATHARGLKLILDFVPNHSSDRHPWFVESAASRTSGKRDWYLWRDAGADGGPPTNWQSQAGGSAWEWHEVTGQYYLHTFLAAQPDLNWRNPAVREAMLGEMRFWFDKGVDGFRLDVVYHCIKDAEFRDDPPNPDHDPKTDPPFASVLPTFSTDRPEIMPLVVEPMRALADACGNRLLIGEIYLPLERLVDYYGDTGEARARVADGERPSAARAGVQLPFNFSLVFADWTADALAALVRRYESLLPPDAWPNWVLGNHDQSRVVSRIGPERARLAAMLLLTLRGTPTIYQGDEIGMRDVEIPPDRVRDPWELNMPGLGEGRDPERTPMRWTDEPGAGFCPADVEPWLPLGDGGELPDVAGQLRARDSMLELHRRLLALRRAHPALALGDYTCIETCGEVLLFAREHGGERCTVALNLGEEPAEAVLPEPGGETGPTVLVSTRPGRDGERLSSSMPLALDALEGVVLDR